jgi:hypothetical protein
MLEMDETCDENTSSRSLDNSLIHHATSQDNWEKNTTVIHRT